MRKHYKLISSVVCLVLCACMIAFGVYAATSGIVSLGVSSEVSFTPTAAKLKIFGGIANAEVVSTESGSLSYYACNYGPTDAKKNYKASTTDSNTDVFNTWNYGEIKFKEYEEATGPAPIYFYIQITNYVERDVDYKITVDTTYTGSDSTGTNVGEYVNISYGYYITDNSSTIFASSEETGAESAGTAAWAEGFWNINDKVEQNIDSIHSSTRGNSKITGDGFFGNSGDFSAVSTSLQTIMLVVKVELKTDKVDDSFNSAGFKFTVDAK